MKIVKLINSGEFDAKDIARLVRASEMDSKVCEAAIKALKNLDGMTFEEISDFIKISCFKKENDGRWKVYDWQIYVSVINSGKLYVSDMYEIVKASNGDERVCVAAINSGKFDAKGIAKIVELSGRCQKVIAAACNFLNL